MKRGGSIWRSVRTVASDFVIARSALGGQERDRRAVGAASKASEPLTRPSRSPQRAFPARWGGSAPAD
jgi:hypothetical protein